MIAIIHYQNKQKVRQSNMNNYFNYFKSNISLYLNYLFVLYAFVIPFSKDINKFIALTIFILWIFEANFKEKLKLIVKNKLIITFVVFIIYSYITILWSEYTKEAIHHVNRYFYYFVFIFIFTSLKKEFIIKTIVAFLLGMFLSEIIMYGIYFDFWTTSYSEKYPGNIPRAFMWHTQYSILIAFTVLLTANKLFFKNDNNILKTLYILLLIITLLSLSLSGGRIGLVIALSSLLLITLYSFKYIAKKAVVILLGTLLILSISYNYINLFKHRVNMVYNDISKVLLNDNYASSLGVRIALIDLGLQISNENILFGVGIKDNLDKKVEYAQKEENKNYKFLASTSHKMHFHNEYIQILTSIGLVGLILFLYFLYALVTIRIKSLEFSNLKLILFTTILLGMMASTILYNRHIIAFIALFIGILLAINRIENENKKQITD